jgi:hypothetical protein
MTRFGLPTFANLIAKPDATVLQIDLSGTQIIERAMKCPAGIFECALLAGLLYNRRRVWGWAVPARVLLLDFPACQ